MRPPETRSTQHAPASQPETKRGIIIVLLLLIMCLSFLRAIVVVAGGDRSGLL